MKKKIALTLTSSLLSIGLVCPVLATSFNPSLPDKFWIYEGEKQTNEIKTGEDSATEWFYKIGNGPAQKISQNGTINGKLDDDLKTIGDDLKVLNRKKEDLEQVMTEKGLFQLDGLLSENPVDDTNLGYVGGSLGNIGGSSSEQLLETSSNGESSIWGSYGKVSVNYADQEAVIDFDSDLPKVGKDIKSLFNDYKKNINIINRVYQKLIMAKVSENTVTIGSASVFSEGEQNACSQNKESTSQFRNDRYQSNGTTDILINGVKVHADFDRDLETIDTAVQDLEKGLDEVKEMAGSVTENILYYDYEDQTLTLKPAPDGENSKPVALEFNSEGDELKAMLKINNTDSNTESD